MADEIRIVQICGLCGGEYGNRELPCSCDYPSDIRSSQKDENGVYLIENDDWIEEIEKQYPFPGACYNCGLTETHVILPDIGEVRCYCGATNARMIDGEYQIVEGWWDDEY